MSGEVLLARTAWPSSTSCDRVQASKFGIAAFQLLDDPQRLPIVAEAAEFPQTVVKHILAGMAKWRMADVVNQCQGLDKILVQTQRPADGSGDGGGFERVRQTAAVIIAQLSGKHLGLVGQPAKGGAMHDPVAIAAKGDR